MHTGFSHTSDRFHWRLSFSVIFFLCLIPAFDAFGQVAATGLEAPARMAWETAKLSHEGKGPVLWLNFPKDGAQYSGSTVRFGGSTEPGSSLSINGKRVKVLENGIFAGTIPLAAGRNQITFRTTRSGNSTAKTIEVRRSQQLEALPAQPLAIETRVPAHPQGDLELLPEDTMAVRCQASPGATAYFQIGDRETRYPMQELFVEPGQASIAGIYSGSYMVQEGDPFEKAPIRITLEIQSEGQKQMITIVPSGTLTTERKSIRRIAESLENDTGIYTDISRDVRYLSAAKGTQLMLTGRRGDMLRTELNREENGWVPIDRVQIISDEKEIPVAQLDKMQMTQGWRSTVGGKISLSGQSTALSLASEKPSDIAGQTQDHARFTFMVKQKDKYRAPLPIRISLAEREKAISLTVYGLQADEFQIYKSGGKSISEPWQSGLEQSLGENNFVRDMQCHPLGEKSTIFRFGLSKKAWGYRTVFAPDKFDLIINAPPGLMGEPTGPLSGIRVALDPGHGGIDSGAVGNSGLLEADANWAITQRIANYLRAANAEVYVTRSEDEYVSLTARAERICDSDADIFLSIHCDSVSEYTNPFESRGTSMFYFYPQGDRLAQQVRVGLTSTLENEVSVLKTSRRDLRVIRACPQMPGALIECLFISNPNDEMLLLNPAFLDRMSAGIYKGLLSFLQNAGTDEDTNGGEEGTDVANRMTAWTGRAGKQAGLTKRPIGG